MVERRPRVRQRSPERAHRRNVSRREGGVKMSAQRFVSFRMVLGLLAVLACIPALVGCGQAAAHNGGDPALPSGWSWYHDTRFPFQVPVPPDWRAGGYTISL